MKRLPLGFFLGLVAIGVALIAGAPPAKARTDHLVVQLKWRHQAQFAGFYAAERNGYYEAEGISVDLVPADHTTDIIGEMAKGAADIAVTSGDRALQAYAAGTPVRIVGVTYQRNPLVLFSDKKLGITTAKDLKGKRIRVSPDQELVFQAVVRAVGLTPDDYEIVNVPSDFDVFKSGKVDVWAAYLSGFAAKLAAEGVELNVIEPGHYRVHFYADTLIAQSRLVESRPELVERFLRATYKGWQWAIEHGRDVPELVARYGPEADLGVEARRFATDIPLLLGSAGKPLGHMDLNYWKSMADAMLRQGLLDAPVDVENAVARDIARNASGIEPLNE